MRNRVILDECCAYIIIIGITQHEQQSMSRRSVEQEGPIVQGIRPAVYALKMPGGNIEWTILHKSR